MKRWNYACLFSKSKEEPGTQLRIPGEGLVNGGYLVRIDNGEQAFFKRVLRME